MDLNRIRSLVRAVPDFPKPGILFRDITPVLADAEAFAQVVAAMAERIAAHAPDGLVAIESRGFLFGAALAQQLHLPLALVRKPGKLPWQKVHVDYQLEYGSDRLEMHRDALVEGDRYALVDDLLATGGTAAAACELVESQNARVTCCAFFVELDALDGRKRLDGRTISALVHY